MNPTDTIRTAAVTAVDLTVRATRLPIDIAERLGADVRATWPPVRVVNTVDAALLDTAARVLDEPKLAARAGLLRTSVERAAEADRLKAQAEATRREADATFDERRQQTTAARRQAEEAAEAERRRVAEAAAAEERAAAERAARREEVQAKKDAERQRAVARKERNAGRTKVAAEREAMRAEKAAAAAEGTALALDDAVEATKARRRAARIASN